MRALLVLLLVGGCDWTLHRMQGSPACATHGTTDLLPGGACAQPMPEGTVAMTPPDRLPPITRDLLVRGRDRFERFCAPCHGLRGDGDSYIARAMQLRKPPPLIDANAQKFDDNRIINVITNGYGLMPSYASALAMRDRFAILQYVRALQQRDVPIDQLSPALREEASRWLR